MRETCLQFGPDRRLAGILTEPSRGVAKQGLVLINAGLVPKFGPYRLYAQLARRAALDGVATLRFDLGGVGDSVQELSGRPLLERSGREIRAAVDELCAHHTLTDVALGGLCSGAEDAFRAAAADPRITRVVLLDPFAYRTRGWAPRHLAFRVGRRVLRAAGLFEPLVSPRTAGQQRAVSYRYMPHAESEAILRALLARNVMVHFVYTAGMREYFNHPGQLRAQFADVDFRDRVTLDYFPHVDHTQLLQADRQAVIEAVTQRLSAAA
jgi:pimeloyl-ACP methyl ester carboxylesterase